MYELAIIGGGPAGSAAAVYAARKQIKTIFLTSEFGGQSVVSTDIQNWIGTPSIAGEQLAKDLEAHVHAYAGAFLDIRKGVWVSTITRTESHFDLGNGITARAVLIATGSKRRTLEAKGADVFEHKGLTYCASCDGPMFSGMPVAVIGGGNAAFEAAAQLLAYCPTVYLLNRSDSFRADEITVEKVSAHPNIRIIKNAVVTEVHGEQFVNGLTYNETERLDVSGIFVEIGQLPNTDLVKDLVQRDAVGRIIIDPKTQQTSVPGIWAAGDCTDVLYHQNNIAAGDGVRALEDIYVTLRTR